MYCRFKITLMKHGFLSKIADSEFYPIYSTITAYMHALMVIANEQRIDSPVNGDAVFTSYRISCKYKLSSGCKHSRHSAPSNYQQDMDLHNVLNLTLWMICVIHKANVANVERRGKWKFNSSVTTLRTLLAIHFSSCACCSIFGCSYYMMGIWHVYLNIWRVAKVLNGLHL